MTHQVFKADRWRWITHNLAFCRITAALALFFYFAYRMDSAPSGIDILSPLAALATIYFFSRGIFAKPPALVFGPEQMRYRGKILRYGEVTRVRRTPGGYDISVGERRLVPILAKCFSETDKKLINDIIALKIKEYSWTEDKLAGEPGGIFHTSQLEFSVQASHTAGFYYFYLVISIACLFVVLAAVASYALGGLSAVGVVNVLIFSSIFFFVILFVEKKSSKDVFCFTDNTFYFFRNARIKYSFHRTEVAAVDVVGNVVAFTLKKKDRSVRIDLSNFSRDAKEVALSNTRRILPGTMP
ncbi:MAG: hypothetical protein LUE10_02055 [Alistipes sp.]|nr:hypothetical protein [Alistipes sp.]